MQIADFQQGDYFCEASFDLDELLWIFREIDASYCDWKLQRQFNHASDLMNFIRNHCPMAFVDDVREAIYGTQ